jgi:hypothetical protein
MEAGFVLDKTQPDVMLTVGEQTEWVEGEAGSKSFWTTGVRLKGKDRRKIVTYCFVGCGYLESYAVKEEA